VKTLFALVLLFDVIALSGAAQVFVMKPVKSARPQLAQAFTSDNQTFPEPDGSGAMHHFGL
jgi:hypothetical protein